MSIVSRVTEADGWALQKRQLTDLFAAVGRIPSLGDCSRVNVSDPIHVSAHARLFLCSLPDSTERFLAKCFYVSGSEQPDTEGARQQFEALVDLNQRHGDTRGFNLVKPYHLFAEQAVIVQSWIEGRSLDRAFSERRLGVSELIGNVEAAGTWLAHFHAFGGAGRTGLVSGTLMNEIAERAAALGQSGRILMRAADLLRASALGAGRTPQPIAPLHSDFKPANVIAAEDGVYAIDFHFSTPASVYFDIAHFLNSMAIDIIKSRRPSLMLRARRMQLALIAGYNRAGGPVDPLVLAYYLVYDLSRYMLEHRNTQASRLATDVRWWAMERLLKLRMSQFRSASRPAAAR